MSTLAKAGLAVAGKAGLLIADLDPAEAKSRLAARCKTS